jgi:hypothetical protein
MIDFDEEGLDYMNSNIGLIKLFKTEAPLIKLFEIGNIKLVIHVLYSNYLKYSVNEMDKRQTLFISLLRHYLSQDNQNLKENYLDFENQILLLYRKGYSAKTEDKAFIKPQDYKSDSRQLKYLLLASYMLKLDDFTLIQALYVVI